MNSVQVSENHTTISVDKLPMPSKETPFRLKAHAIMPLSVRTDRHAVARAAGHLGAILLVAAALAQTLGSWAALPLTVLLGYLVAFLFTLEHETAHQTAFKTRAWNYALGHLAGFASFLPYEYYRVYHWDHHRYTQDPEKDPELSVPLPTSRLGLVWLFLGVPIWRGRLRMLFMHALLGQVNSRWVSSEKVPMIVREARWYVVAYLAVAIISVATSSALAVWLWIVPLLVGQLFLRPYLLAEHTGCEHNANMLENTRTTYTNRFVHFFAWNMPYHVAHHAYPAVPFHALPALNKLLEAHTLYAEKGYHASTVAVVRYLAQKRIKKGQTPIGQK